MTKIEQLKKEIQRVKPEIEQRWTTTEIIEKLSGKEIYRSKSVKGRKITLEDVLTVLTREPSNFEMSAWCDGTIFFRNDGKNCVWLLGKPLDDQSEETINFLHSLIIK